MVIRQTLLYSRRREASHLHVVALVHAVRCLGDELLGLRALQPGLITDVLTAWELRDRVFDDATVVVEAVTIFLWHPKMLAFDVLFGDFDENPRAAILSVARQM